MQSQPSNATASGAKGCLRILHLEDNPTDRALVRETLLSEEIDCEFSYAATSDEVVAALATTTFDIILSDFTMPGYDGNAALAMVRKKYPDVPYVFVSGTIGEERAIESMKNGATDYVLKNHLERLLPAVRRALREAGERAARQAAENALRAAEARFREIFENAVEGIYQATPEGRVLEVNRTMARLCGYTSPAHLCASVRNLDLELFVDPERRRKFTQILDEQGEALGHESQIRRHDGSMIWIAENARAVRGTAGELLYYESMVSDITRNKLLEAQLLQAQKMEAVGQLAGGVAHDFNNVLTVVIGYARLLLDGGKLPAEFVEPLTQIYTAGARAANLTRQLLVFSRKQALNRRAIDLNGVVEDIATMLSRLIGEHIQLDVHLAAQPPMIEGDSGMIEQVIMNLAVNARDAMAGGGTLTISTEELVIADPAKRQHPKARAGDYVCLSVRDTGCGIAPDDLLRIFEPFFTTKAEGRGTGLGLATVFGIVEQHQGWIEVESTVGAGTCFRILLPASLPELPLTARRGGKAAVAHGGSETVLLVEDEASVREFGVAVLRSHGYRVLQASSGVEALEVWKWHAERISLLFSDLVLPGGLTGVELAATLRQQKPTLRVILASGYADESLDNDFRPPAGVHFLNKPYKPQVLAQTVRDALDGTFHR